MKKINVAILGLGTVGRGVYQILQEDAEKIAHKEHLQIFIKKVLSRSYHLDIPEEQKTANIEEIVNDPDIDIVIEVMGGLEPAKTYVLRALVAGKTVVSANKQMIANFWPELEEAAKKSGAGFYFEASVGGGIPILRAIDDSLQANTMRSIFAIINGTTNYILTKMTAEGLDYAEALRGAQALGYAEADPTADVEGYDAMYKLSILASKAFHARLPIEHVYREGISRITKQDIQYAADFGRVIKLLAIAKRRGDDVELRVHPTMIPLSHPLANVLDSFNAILMNGSAVGDVMFYGQGAGSLPTASAVLSDVIYAAHVEKPRYATFENRMGFVSPILHFEQNWVCPFYIRLTLLNVPGALAQVTKQMGDCGISILSAIQKDAREDEATIVFQTYPAEEQALQRAVAGFQEMQVVKEVGAVIRMED